MPELLAPAGNMAALRAAVLAGADAVYIGAKVFNARAYADNFDWDGVRRAADYCHLRGAFLYLTLNTMILEDEVAEGVEAARQAYLAGVDALIVADMGLADAIRRCCPKMPLHASTQMCVHNKAGAQLACESGFKRVVLARELSLEDIREITGESGIEAEVFVHGALCSSVSGLCLLSSFIGRRSGNRGRCAQPCRMEYSIGGKDAYYLSMGDLCTAEMIPDLIRCGVLSFKIEGRMKNSLYVGGVVREYRGILDAVAEGRPVPSGSIERLSGYYNRTFTNSYLAGGTDVTAPDRPGNRNIDKDRPEGYGEETAEKIYHTVSGSVFLQEGKRPVMALASGEWRAEAAGEEVLPAAHKPLTEKIVMRSAAKTGGTPFKIDRLSVDIIGNPYISMAALNGLRKKTLMALEGVMLKEYRMRGCPPCGNSCKESGAHKLSAVYVQTGSVKTAIRSLRMGAERVYYNPDIYDEETLAEAKRIGQETGIKPYITLPPFLRKGDEWWMEKLLQGCHSYFAGALAGNFSQITLLKKYFENVVADYTCNIANGQTIRFYREKGFAGVCLSAELSRKDINDIKGVLPTEIIAYGYLPLMWLAHPLYAERMSDRRGYQYTIRKVKVKSELQTVLNPVLLAMRELSTVRFGVDAIRLLLDDDAGVLSEYVHAAQEGINAEISARNTTQGHLKRGV